MGMSSGAVGGVSSIGLLPASISCRVWLDLVWEVVWGCGNVKVEALSWAGVDSVISTSAVFVSDLRVG